MIGSVTNHEGNVDSSGFAIRWQASFYLFVLGIMVMPASAQQCVDTLRTQHLQQVEVNALVQHRMVNSTAPLQLLAHQDFTRLGVTDIADALHRMPGINLRDYGGAGGLKTVAVRGFGAGHTGVSYDGMLLSECQGGEIDVSRYSLDQVQTLKLTIGDNDDIFISARQASVAAMLAIETMNEIPADHRVHLSTQLQVGSFGFVSPYLHYVQRLSDRFTFQAMGEYTYAENDYPFLLHNGKYTTHERRTNSRMNSGHGELNMHWMMGRRTDGMSRSQLWAKLYYYDNDRQLPGIVRYYTNLNAEQQHDRNAFAQARWQTRSLDDHWMLKVQAKMNWASSAYRDTLVANRRNDATYWQREYDASAALMWMPSENWAVDYSADWLMNSLNSTLATDLRPRRHGILQSIAARYTQGRWVMLARMLSSVYLNSVGRKIEAQQGNSNPIKAGQAAKDARRFSPSFSLSYRLLGTGKGAGNGIGTGDELYLRASYKDIFRVPTFNENYFFHYGSSDLKPEKTRQLNVGMTWKKTSSANGGNDESLRYRRWSLLATVDGYRNRVSDKIVGVPYNMFIWRTVNVARVDVVGVDASLRGTWQVAPGQQLSLQGSYSYQHVVNHTDRSSKYYGNQIAYIPLHSGSMALGWENPWVNVSLHGQGMSQRWANNEHYEDTEVDGYWDMGLTIYRKLDDLRLCGKSLRGMKIRMDVKNLLAKQYELVAHYPMPRRSWMLSIGYSF